MMNSVRTAAVAAALVLLVSGGIPPGHAAPPQPAVAPAAPPKLVVMIVVDQLRTDYLERYSGKFTGGLRRLTQDGAWFTHGAYPYLNTVTCAGHSTIGTGALPYRHGMILNAWYNRSTAKSIECTEDVRAREISYNKLKPALADSGRWLLVPTLADRIRERAHGRVAVFSLKARSAIGLAGHHGNPVVWFDDRGGWATSSAYAPGPTPFLQEFIDENPITAASGTQWDRMHPVSDYQGADDATGEKPPTATAWTRTFPHAIGAPDRTADARFYTQWRHSPLADEYLERMAAAAVDALNLGKGRGTDFLGVSFSTLDLVGHAFGPNSHEVQDVLARVDLTIGRLLDQLDTKVGAGNYVVGFSADHGVGQIPEQAGAGGRHTAAEVREAIDKALVPIFGAGKYMAHNAYTDVYLAKGIASRLRRSRAATTAVLDGLRAMPGIAYAFTAGEVSSADARASSDPVKRAAALSYRPGRSGDLIIVPRVNWMFSTAAATHGTLYPHDQRVPVILFGAGIKKGSYEGDATPADIAPTLAAVARVRFEQTDGHVLADALVPPPSTR
jgi:predicted AlkP superfamily pyrophosphatase or phosphodiesterase